MDAWGIGFIFAGIVLWLVTHKRYTRWASFALLVTGFGIGLFVGAVAAVVMFNSVFSY